MRIVFMGTPEFSVPTLVALHESGHQVVAVYSQPPRPAGRGMGERKSPVHEKSVELGIPVFTPSTLKTDDALETFRAHKCDVAVVVAYGLLLPKAILDTPGHGCYNGHASLLPRWRGAAPIQRAIMAGDQETGMMVMRMEEGLDTGPVAMTARLAIGPNETAGELHDRLREAGAALMVGAMDALEAGELELVPQSEEGVLYAAKIDKSEARIDWSNAAREVHDHVRGLSPFPGAWCEMVISGKTHRVKLLKTERVDGDGAPGKRLGSDLTIACGNGAVKIERLQRAGKQAMTTDEFLRGYPLEAITQIR